MITHHYGTSDMIRQCVAPGDYVQYQGRTYIASANDIKKNRLFVRSFSERRCIHDCTVKVYLDINGMPIKANKW